MKRPSATTLAAWTRLMRAQHSALSAIETALKTAGLPPLAWYDVLLELEGAAEGLRPFELERRMLLPQYSLSRLLDRIEQAGLIARKPFAEDGRGQLLLITEAGVAMRKKIWPVYASAINAAIGDHLSEDEAATLAGLLEKLIR